MTDGQVGMPSGRTYGSTALVSCNAGYTLAGSNFVTCLSNGSWSDQPTCLIVGTYVFLLQSSLNLSISIRYALFQKNKYAFKIYYLLLCYLTIKRHSFLPTCLYIYSCISFKLSCASCRQCYNNNIMMSAARFAAI